jgi:hypothetical protein
MEWTQFLSMLGVTILGSGGISGIIIYLWRKQIDAKYEKELECFKTVQQQELEGYKAGYQRFLNENNIRFSRWYNDQAKAITDLHSNLSMLHLALRTLTQPMHPYYSNEDERKKYFSELTNDVRESYSKSLRCWYANKIFINEQHQQIDSLLYKSREAFFSHEDALRSGHIEEYRAAHAAADRFECILNSLRNDLINVLQGNTTTR